MADTPGRNPDERPVRWCVLSDMTDEPLSEFHSRANHAIGRRARALLFPVIALISLVMLGMLQLITLLIMLAGEASTIP